MAIPSRHASTKNILAGARTFFVTSSVLGKRNLLQSARCAELFLEVLYHYRERGNYLLHEFVVMPDHFHLLLTVGADMTVERAVQLIKGGFAFRAGRELGLQAPIWQKGFSETRTWDVETYIRERDYIRQNPVHRRLVGSACDYPYSSANPGLERDSAPEFGRSSEESRFECDRIRRV